MTAPGTLTGCTALVTGASRGIGRAIAMLLARNGARVALHYNRNRAAAQSALRRMPGSGHALFRADLERGRAAARLVEVVQRRFGRLDVLVNNAGIYEMHPVLRTSPERWLSAWRRTIAINLLAPAQLSHAAARLMARRGGGRIINISSRGAFRGEPDASAYGASKAGLNALSQSMAKALASSNVYAYAIAPGWVETDLAARHLRGAAGRASLRDTPLGRAASPDEIAQTVLFLATDAPPSMTGAILDVNGASYLRS